MIEYRLLGPIEAAVDGRVLDMGGRKLRALLALFLLNANESVPRDVLIDRLWGERAPAGAQHTLEVYISRLRKTIEPAAGSQVVLTRPGAYLFVAQAEQIDVRRFERLGAEGRRALAANEPDRAAGNLRAALHLWRGSPLADVGDEPFAARAAEARHRARVQEPSALAGVAYGPSREEHSLLHFTVVAVDGVIDDFATRFAAGDSDERDTCRSGLTMDDFYTLPAYARRAAVRAIRSGDEAVAQRGLAALAVIDLDRVDWRDVTWQAGLLSYAIARIGGKTGGAFTTAASLANGETAALLASLARWPPADLSDWGFREVNVGGAPGLIEDDGEPYRPQADLVELAEAVAAGMRGDIWQFGDPVTGSALPTVWLRRGQPDEFLGVVVLGLNSGVRQG